MDTETTELPRNTVAHFLPGNLPDDEGEYPPHTPWMKFGPDHSGPWVIRCGGPTLDTCHQSFDSLTEWAEHVCGQEVENARSPDGRGHRWIQSGPRARMMTGLCDCCEEPCDELIPATDCEYWVCPQCVLALITG